LNAPAIWQHIFAGGRLLFASLSTTVAFVKPKRVRLFIKPYCPWCQKAVRWLDERGIKHETIDVIADESAYAEMMRLSGQELTPVIEAGGKVLADFGPEQLAGFWDAVNR
jgi:glutaredoxin 3